MHSSFHRESPHTVAAPSATGALTSTGKESGIGRSYLYVNRFPKDCGLVRISQPTIPASRVKPLPPPGEYLRPGMEVPEWLRQPEFPGVLMRGRCSGETWYWMR